MSIVNFNLKQPLEQKVNRVIKEQGFTSKAEFFRFVTLVYLNHQIGSSVENDRYTAAVNDLRKVLHRKLAHKKLPALREQLADLE